ncbi:IPTL-CTERM sorting domain-containing protein [Lampropedia aestuarii]|uniref:IPTL-CTERM sorting domain-containing protein n=1 Tax=Lampropedia aestuarii TaxID=2562762 RepID=UPI0024692710|nr:IPTL-CTERM sorting domain-containing protein [Lampropedia aestuarii]MDH5856553.1 IPTL-CTERM sorting domain-containing protein [Lampropedia aestuarii]
MNISRLKSHILFLLVSTLGEFTDFDLFVSLSVDSYTVLSSFIQGMVVMFKKVLFACVAAACVGSASAATVLPADIVSGDTFNWSSGGVTGDPYGNGNDINNVWGQVGLIGGANVEVTGDFPRSGNGSLKLESNGNAQAKAGVAYYPPYPNGFGPLGSINTASYDWYVQAGSNSPAMRIYLFDNTTDTHVATLIWMATNNGVPLTTGAWQPGDVLNGYVWQTKGGVQPEYQIPASTPKLFSEVKKNPAFENLTVRAIEIGFGSGGWGADFVGFADNVQFAGEAASVAANFEFEPAPAVAATPTPVPTMSEWALILMSALLGGLALLRVQRSRQA